MARTRPSFKLTPSLEIGGQRLPNVYQDVPTMPSRIDGTPHSSATFEQMHPSGNELRRPSQARTKRPRPRNQMLSRQCLPKRAVSALLSRLKCQENRRMWRRLMCQRPMPICCWNSIVVPPRPPLAFAKMDTLFFGLKYRTRDMYPPQPTLGSNERSDRSGSRPVLAVVASSFAER